MNIKIPPKQPRLGATKVACASIGGDLDAWARLQGSTKCNCFVRLDRKGFCQIQTSPVDGLRNYGDDADRLLLRFRRRYFGKHPRRYLQL